MERRRERLSRQMHPLYHDAMDDLYVPNNCQRLLTDGYCPECSLEQSNRYRRR